MRRHDNAHSRLVAWAKIVLPLVALGLLSTLFLISRGGAPEAVPYAQVDVAAIAREERLGAPEFAGMTRDGAALTVTAAGARLGPGAPAAEGVRARLEAPKDGLRADLTAAGARLEGGEALLLEDGVRLETSAGYRLAAPQVRIGTADGRIEAAGGITGTAPFGRIEAGAMALVPEAGGHVLRFTDGVRLVYRPQSDPGPAPAKESPR